jgi:hypothetical protein
MNRKFYWIEDRGGIVLAHGAEAKKLYPRMQRHGDEPHLYYVYQADQRPPVGVHGDSWEAPPRW